MLVINNVSLEEPPKVGPQCDGAFLKTLLKSLIEFRFDNVGALESFLVDHAKDHKEAQRKFEEPRYQKLFSPILDVEVTEDLGAVKWRYKLKVKTKHGDFEIELFTSVKRHALLSFLSHHSTPRNPKEKNTLVRDADLLRKCFGIYCNKVVTSLKMRGYAFRFDAQQFNKETIESAMVISCDSKPISEDPGQRLELHVFPSSGPEVAIIDDHKKYDALVTFLLWFFRTEQCSGAASGYSKVEKIKREQGQQNYDEYVKNLQKSADFAREQYKALKSAGVDLDKPIVPKDAAAIDRKAHGWAVQAAKVTHALLAAHGQVARVETTKRNAIANPAKPNTNKAAKDKHVAGQIMFKTHKAEVKAKSADMPWAQLAWLLQGHLQKDIGEIKVVIENHTINKAKNASLVAVGPEDSAIAHSLSMKERLDREEDRAALNGATELHDKINQAIKWYDLAIKSGIPLLASVKPA